MTTEELDLLRLSPSVMARHADAPPYQTHERLQQEVEEPLGRALPILRLVQLRSGSQVDSQHPGDAGGDHGSDLGNCGFADLGDHYI